MTTDYIYDTFSGADGSNLSARAGETGASWTWLNDGGSNAAADRVEIHSGGVRLRALSAGTSVTHNPSGRVLSDRFFMEAGFVVDSASMSFQSIELSIAFTPYWEGISLIAISADSLSDLRFGPFSANRYDPPGGNFIPGVEYVARVEVEDLRVNTFVDGVYTGTFNRGSDRLGAPILSMFHNKGSGVQSGRLSLSYLRVGPMGPPPPPPPPPVFWSAFVDTYETP